MTKVCVTEKKAFVLLWEAARKCDAVLIAAWDSRVGLRFLFTLYILDQETNALHTDFMVAVLK